MEKREEKKKELKISSRAENSLKLIFFLFQFENGLKTGQFGILLVARDKAKIKWILFPE